MVPQTPLHQCHIGCLAKLIGKAGHAVVADAAGYNRLEIRQIWIGAERTSVPDHPSAAFPAEGSELLVADPRAGVPLDATRLQTEGGTGADGHFLEGAQVAVDVGEVAI